jgi:tRNA threonylcarbamoyladenosine modification (KEOPS) complex  Pcc1 subunit
MPEREGGGAGECWEATLTLADWPEEKVDRLVRVLQPESGDMLGKTTVSFTKERGCVVMHITADSTSSLRAALNSYLKWMDMANKVDSLAQSGPRPVPPSKG